MMKATLCFQWFLLLAMSSFAAEQTRPQPFPQFSVTAGRLDSGGFSQSGAKLCVNQKASSCYQMPSRVAEGSTASPDAFGLAPQAQRLQTPNGGSLVLFSATASAGGSGATTRLAMLQYEGQGIINLLPLVDVSNVGEHAAWNLPRISPYPLLLTADFIWGQGEGHFAPHFYTVEAWKFNPKAGRYEKSLSYRTSRKYDGESVHVLEPERAVITKRLESR